MSGIRPACIREASDSISHEETRMTHTLSGMVDRGASSRPPKMSAGRGTIVKGIAGRKSHVAKGKPVR